MLSGSIVVGRAIFMPLYQREKDIRENFGEVYFDLKRKFKKTDMYETNEEYHKLREMNEIFDNCFEELKFPSWNEWDQAKKLIKD